ncbi:hypothetical protein Anacy_0635 [Anabaena cylindrica PCC 7122]|uniref:Uncharacterized protein n=1 Tax=Anabaena cylindrica (strain ATCC 27899 / PCC 7122) TaxID=272123 RepID=K9ZCB6_ANACC|nr:hypothetical protein Anacy_0635 [Anabaena cylindrica PCC 7122]BAY01341.1 hypothetical protein NIES19_05710 [Anabaena cylindrica PCC 7122]
MNTLEKLELLSENCSDNIALCPEVVILKIL